MIPAGITTATVHLDAPVSFTGDPGRLHVVIEPSTSLIWTATGTPLGSFVDTFALAPGKELVVELPHTDQPGFEDGFGNAFTGWYYTAIVVYEKDGRRIDFPPRDFQILSGQLEVDLALVPAGEAIPEPAIAPILPVTSIEGLTGAVTKTMLSLQNVTNTSDTQKVAAGPIKDALDLKAPINNPTFTGTVGGVTKGMVGLGAVNNTSDVDKPVSTAQAEELVKKVAKGDLVKNVMDYGATGDGISNDTAAVQAAIDAAPEHGYVYIAKKHLITAVTLDKRWITLTGPGTLFGGKLMIGTATGARRDLYITIDGITFERGDRTAGTYGIELLRARRVTIKGCSFIGFDKSIYIRPLADAVMHDTGMINIKDNEFAGCNYALYADRDEAATWMHFSDSHFVNNTINTSYICGIWIRSVDGIHITGNTFFTIAYNSSDSAALQAKKQNIYMGQSNFFVISHNNLFEAGEESILIDQASRFTISNNNIAWPGQKVPSDGIKLTGTNTLNGIISDNVISKPTKDGIGIYATGTGTVSIKDNAIEYDAATGTYYGTTPLSSIPHHGIYQDAISSQINLMEMGNEMTAGLYVNRRGSLLAAMRISNDASVSASKASVAITAATATPVFTLTSQRSGQLSFSGELIVEVKASDSENTNISVYKFLVSKGPLGYYITKMGEQGLLTGGSANWPSFTFTIRDTDGKLIATPVGATAGTFHFFVTALGNVRALAA